jgi:Zn finger protein HypA/HybF involved in hydrogenase expression
MRNRKRYGKDWKRRSRAAKERVGWKCEKCGAVHGSERYSEWLEREVKVWLQAHHLSYEPEILLVVCPRCHWKEHRRKGGPPPRWYLESMKHRKLIAIAFLS